jgi:hypothetical protein
MSGQSRSGQRNPSRGAEFSLPSPDAFDKLVRDQKLERVPAHELRIVLYHVDKDLEYRRKTFEGRQPRDELVRRLKRIAKCVDDLEFELHRWRKTINDFLPQDSRAEIGLLMSYSAMEAALNTEIRRRDLKSEVENLATEDPDFRMAQIEELLAPHREARGLEHGGEFFTHYIERINKPMKHWIELDRFNRGGRPLKNLARDLLLFRLAEAAPAIIGRRATATAGGPFVRLCVAVVVACGLGDRGIERAVEKAIAELSKQRRKGFRRIPRPPAATPQTRSAKS